MDSSICIKLVNRIEPNPSNNDDDNNNYNPANRILDILTISQSVSEPQKRNDRPGSRPGNNFNYQPSDDVIAISCGAYNQDVEC